MPQDAADPQPADNKAAASQEAPEPQQTESDTVDQQNTIASAGSEQLEQEDTEASQETTDAPAERKEDAPLSPATTYAGSPAEAAARTAEAAAAAAAETGPRCTAAVADALTAKGRQILEEYPAAAEVYMTSNGFGFFREQDARNHAATLRDKTVINVKRK